MVCSHMEDECIAVEYISNSRYFANDNKLIKEKNKHPNKAKKGKLTMFRHSSPSDSIWRHKRRTNSTSKRLLYFPDPPSD